MSFSRSRSFLPLSLSLFVCLCVCRWRWLRCFYDSFINVKRQKSMQCIHIVPLYTITTTMFGCCLLLGCEKYRQTTRFVVVFPLFPYLCFLAACPTTAKHQRERGAPNHLSALCVSSSSALGKNVSATPNISWVRRRVGAKNWVNFCLSCCFSCSFCACWSSSKINKKNHI